MVQTVELENHTYYSDGRLWSKKYKKFLKPQLLQRSQNHHYVWGKGGYPAYKINGKYEKIHRLQAKYFLPNPNPKEFNCVLHLDDDQMNWQLSNLTWGDQKLNMQMYTERKMNESK